MERETIEFDVLFVGGGPASLAGAIRLMQLAKEKQLNIEVGLIEKGAEIGSHAISGAILNPSALEELIPDYREQGCPIETTVRDDEFYFLTRNRHVRLPIVPRYMHNKGFYVISLSRFSRWLGQIAEGLGVNVFPGFAGNEILFAEDGRTVTGVRTGDKGRNKDGSPKGNFEPGIDIRAKITLFGEGARGSLMQSAAQKLGITSGRMPQVYETGIKEVIQLPKDNYFTTSQGNDIHTLGYPLDFFTTPGGGFIYEMKDNCAAVGFLVGLSYPNPSLDPYEEFIKFKRHPLIAKIIKGGKILEQGARTVSTGGWFTIPELAADGAMFIGGCAGIHNTPGLKGIHVSMKSGMLAAETAIAALEKGDFSKRTLEAYPHAFETSSIRDEIYEGRNFTAALAKQGPIKLIYLGAQYVTKGRGIRDFMRIEEDCRTLRDAKLQKLINAVEQPKTGAEEKVPEFDGVLYADKLTGVYLSKTMHREDQPSHIRIRDLNLCMTECLTTYECPCTKFCPGKVYELEADEQTAAPRLKLNPANCLHCKTCDIKDPYRNITWTCPEGGEGPSYTVV